MARLMTDFQKITSVTCDASEQTFVFQTNCVRALLISTGADSTYAIAASGTTIPLLDGVYVEMANLNLAGKTVYLTGPVGATLKVLEELGSDS